MLSRQNLLLRSLLPSVFDVIKPHLRLVFLHKGEDLTTLSHRRNVYFPISCGVAIYARSAATPETYLCLVGTDGCAGLSETLTTAGLNYLSRVTRSGYAFAIARQVFLQRAWPSGEALNLQLVSTGMVAQLSLTNAGCAALHSSRSRVARILLEAVAVWGDRVSLDLEHRELADFICVRRETVTLILKEFDKSGLIRTGRGQLSVLNLDGLTRMACDCHRHSLDSKTDWYRVWKSINRYADDPVNLVPKNTRDDTPVSAGGGSSANEYSVRGEGRSGFSGRGQRKIEINRERTQPDSDTRAGRHGNPG